MNTIFRRFSDLSMKGRVLFLFLIFISLLLFFYSYTQVDLNLTLTPSVYPLSFQSFFKQIGYYNRPLSACWYIFLLLSLIGIYITAYFSQKKMFEQKHFWPLLILVTIILTLSYNAFSYDLFNYIFDARIVTLYHQNPYLHAAQDFHGDPMLQFMRWVHRVYPYGPFWLGLTIPLSFIGLQNFFFTQLLFKVLIAVCFLGTVHFIGKIQAALNPQLSLLSMVFFSLNPLVLIESLVSAHNDIVMLFFAILSLYFLVIKKDYIAYLFLFISIGIKFATVFLLPIYLYVFYLRKKKKEVIWEKIIFLMLCMMWLAVLAVTLRTNFQPWYLLYVLPFASLLPQKPFSILPSGILSCLALTLYTIFIYAGSWDVHATGNFMQAALSSVIIASILTGGWYFLYHKKIWT